MNSNDYYDPTASASDTKVKKKVSGKALVAQEVKNAMNRAVDARGFELLKFLGKGSYGSVYHAEQRDTHQIVAMKRVNRIFSSNTTAKRLLREISLLKRLQHMNIVTYLGSLKPLNINKFTDLYYITEKLDTDLAHIINSRQFFTKEHIRHFLYHLCNGLHFMHSMNVIHRDLKPANLLVTSDCKLKICDFGLARTGDELHPLPVPLSETDTPPPSASQNTPSLDPMQDSSGNTPVMPISTTKSTPSSAISSPTVIAPPPPLQRQWTKHVVTRWYRAPELILGQPYDSEIDMWSAGCILAELLTMDETSFPDCLDRNPIFPGKSCFPLSGGDKSNNNDHKDQLNVIFDVIGTPSEEDINAVASEEARKYLRSLPHKDPVSLASKFYGADPGVLEILQGLLEFNPAKRLTARQVMEHPYCKSLLKPEHLVVPTKKLRLPFEDKKLSMDDIKRLIISELASDHPELLESVHKKYRLAPAEIDTKSSLNVSQASQRKRHRDSMTDETPPSSSPGLGRQSSTDASDADMGIERRPSKQRRV